jgi:hypothetical protein
MTPSKNRGPQISSCDTRPVNAIIRLLEERGVRDTVRIFRLALEKVTEAPAARKKLLEQLEQWMTNEIC